MKKNFIFVVLFASVLILSSSGLCFAWIEGGSAEIGLNGFADVGKRTYENCATCSKNENETTNLSLTAGYFITRNFEIGGTLSRDSRNDKNTYPTNPTNNSTSESQTITLAPMIRVLFNVQEHSVIVPYVGFEAGIIKGDSSSKFGTSAASSADLDGTLTAASLGIKYFPVDMASINFDLKYRKRSFESKSSASTTTVKYDNDGILFAIGASIFF